MRKWWIFKAVKIAVCVVVFGALLGWVVMSLWNYLVPELFKLPPISFWQGVGLLFLCKILFTSFRGKGGCGWKRGGCCGSSAGGCGCGNPDCKCGSDGNCNSGGYGHWGHGWFRNRMKAKMESMSPEEREKFKEKLYKKCCGDWTEEGETKKQ